MDALQIQTARFDRFIRRSRERFEENPPAAAIAVSGCASALKVQIDADDRDRLTVKAWSDGIVTRIIGNMLAEYYTGLSCQETAFIQPTFFEDSGLADSISAGRLGGYQNFRNLVSEVARTRIARTASVARNAS